ncbi:3'-5' exonuclease [Streptomyces sp. ok210]|uniref:3'-5' exonuclease n=1 Tax=Streptomyces sp. ok210 TaxID=1761905 RepID=UPI0008F37284|nr:3'-5' exonuclease [Streptomyces sp. ok210]SFT31866.1 DNA polymerase III, epsilon subunit [Streptomyces sp. ok210]
MSTQTTARAPRPIAFIDTETTGLDPDSHQVWEIAVIMRTPGEPDGEHHWQIRPTELHLAQSADPKALEIGRYQERMVIPNDYFVGQIDAHGRPVAMSHKTLAYDLTKILKGAVLVGSNPAFDAAFLRVFLDSAPWHYRTVDIATMAVGHLYGQAHALTRQHCDAEAYGRVDALLAEGWRSYELSRQMGVEPPSKADAHTALGDARWARDVYDAITQPDAFYAATDDQLGQMAGVALSRFHGGAQ